MPAADENLKYGKTRNVRQAQPPRWSDARVASRKRYDEQQSVEDPPCLYKVEEAELLTARRSTEDAVLSLRVYW